MEFAVGRDTHDGCACPAVNAGYSPSSGDESIEIAEMWDEIVRARTGKDRGAFTVSERIAKSAWIEAIESMQNDALMTDRERDAAVDIAEQIGWL
jgi:hypothetical protein